MSNETSINVFSAYTYVRRIETQRATMAWALAGPKHVYPYPYIVLIHCYNAV